MLGHLRIGAFAEYIAIDQADLALKPTSLTMDEAAAVPLVALAAWHVSGETLRKTDSGESEIESTKRGPRGPIR